MLIIKRQDLGFGFCIVVGGGPGWVAKSRYGVGGDIVPRCLLLSGVAFQKRGFDDLEDLEKQPICCPFHGLCLKGRRR